MSELPPPIYVNPATPTPRKHHRVLIVCGALAVIGAGIGVGVVAGKSSSSTTAAPTTIVAGGNLPDYSSGNKPSVTIPMPSHATTTLSGSLRTRFTQWMTSPEGVPTYQLIALYPQVASTVLDAFKSGSYTNASRSAARQLQDAWNAAEPGLASCPDAKFATDLEFATTEFITALRYAGTNDLDTGLPHMNLALMYFQYVQDDVHRIDASLS